MNHASKLGTARLAAEEAQTCSRLLAEGVSDPDARAALILRKQAACVAGIEQLRAVLADSRIGVDR